MVFVVDLVLDRAVVGASPVDASAAELAEGRGVAAALGEEVAAVAGHVCPTAKPCVRVLGVLGSGEQAAVTQAPAGVDEAAGVGVGGVEADGGLVEPAGEMTGRLRCLGRVLGEVAGDGLPGEDATSSRLLVQLGGNSFVAKWVAAADSDRADVELGAPSSSASRRVGR